MASAVALAGATSDHGPPAPLERIDASSNTVKRKWSDESSEKRSKDGVPSRSDDTPSNAGLAEEQSNNPPKRQRVSRACDQCRTKKDKCDGLRPTCSTCSLLDRPCTYKTNPKKRGLPTGYIRTLELLWGLVFQKIHGSEEVARVLLTNSNMPGRLATMGKEGEASTDTLLSSWKKSTVLKEIERLLVILEQPEDYDPAALHPDEARLRQDEAIIERLADGMIWQIPDDQRDIDDFTKKAPSVMTAPSPIPSAYRPRSLPPTNDSSTQTDETELDKQIQPFDVQQLRADWALNAEPSWMGNTPPQLLRLPSKAWHYFDIYFSYTHCWLPIIEKHDVLRTSYAYNDHGLSISSAMAGSGDHAAMWAILALTSAQENASRTSSRTLNYDDERPQPALAFATARHLIPTEDKPYEIGHVQALLILALISCGKRDWSSAWSLVGYTIRMAHSLQLDCSPPEKSSEGSRGRRRHVLLGCFVLETLIASRVQKAPHLRRSDAENIGPLDEDGLEEWHPWEDLSGLQIGPIRRGSARRGPVQSLSIFNQLVRVSSIMNDLCCYLHNQAASPNQLDSIVGEYHTWVTNLRRGGQLGFGLDKGSSQGPQVVNLHLVSDSTRLMLQRLLRNGQIQPNTEASLVVSGPAETAKLARFYMETYCLAATPPTFTIFLDLAVSASESNLGTVLDRGDDLEAVSAQLETMWSAVKGGPGLDVGSYGLETAQRHSVPTGQDQAYSERRKSSGTQAPNILSAVPESTSLQRETWPDMSIPGGVGADNFGLAVPEPELARNKMRKPENVITQSPTRHRGSMGGRLPVAKYPLESQTPPHTHGRSRAASTSDAFNSSGLVPDLMSNLNGSTFTSYPQQPFPANSNMGPPAPLNVAGLDPGNGKAASRQTTTTTIPAELDALFDELVSLDGTENNELQPQFMQNLGFAPDSAVTEFYSYYGPDSLLGPGPGPGPGLQGLQGHASRAGGHGQSVPSARSSATGLGSASQPHAHQHAHQPQFDPTAAPQSSKLSGGVGMAAPQVSLHSGGNSDGNDGGNSGNSSTVQGLPQNLEYTWPSPPSTF